MAGLIMTAVFLECLQMLAQSSRAVRTKIIALYCYGCAHPSECFLAVLWVLTGLGLLVLHASEILGDWTPVLVDPLLCVVAAMLMLCVRRALRGAAALPVAQGVGNAPVKSAECARGQ